MAIAAAYKDLTKTCAILCLALGIFAVMGLVGLWSNWLQVEMLQQVSEGGQVAASEAAANDLRQRRISQVIVMVYAITAILFLRWTYLANRNTEYLTTVKRQNSPGWAVGWYFIPVASLWKPYQAMKETFRASDPAYSDNWQQSQVPQLASVWWFIWITWNAGVIYVSTRSSRAATLEELLTASQLAMASSVTDVALGLVGVLLVYKLHVWQRDKHRNVATAAI